MKLAKDEYTISRKTLERVLEALGNNWFIPSAHEGDDDMNNDEVIEAQEELEAEISRQQ